MQGTAARLGWLVLSLAVLLADSPRPGFAIDTAVVHLGSVSGAGWSAQGVTLQLDWQEGTGTAVVMRLARLQLPAPLGEFTAVSLHCPQLHYDGTQADCPAGRLEAQSSRFGQQRVKVRLHYHVPDQSLALQLEDVRYLGGSLDLQAGYSGSGWTAKIGGKRLQAAAFIRQAIALGYPVPGLSGDGRVDLQAHLRGIADTLAELTLDLQLQDVTFTNDAGSLAAEHAALNAGIRVRPHGRDWQVRVQASTPGGAWYFDPVYLEVTDRPVRLDARFDWQPQQRRLNLRQLDYHHPGVAELHASGQLVWQDGLKPDTLQVELHEGVLPALYDTYLQPWLTRTAAGALQTRGQLEGSLQIAHGTPVAARLTLSEVGVEQRDALFGVQGMNGKLDWSAQQSRTSQLGWRSGHVYRIDLGASQLALESIGRRVSLAHATQIPVLDGDLDIETFELEQAPDRPLHWAVDGILTPVSMQKLTAALDWPGFGGTLSGVIPQVSYDDGNLTVGGILLVRVFDGEVTLRDLKLEQPLGQVPRLQVDARAKNIDLEQLTRTFSFGRIEGRLDGRIDGLQMVAWEPVAFDAEFATPAGDRSRHRISQKAVDNISNIGGGGVGGALSRSFLRFLEDFPYDRLGIRCKLQDGVCAMGGVAPADNGYYLVKGRFIPPRLDVIGYSDRVNWAGLVQQLKQVTHGQAPVVQ